MLSRYARVCLLGLFLVHLACGPEAAEPPADVPPPTSRRLASIAVGPEDLVVTQTVYVPVYSHIYRGSSGMSFDLTATLSVRNVDSTKSLVLQSVAYYDSDGALVREYLDGASAVGPLATADFVVGRTDTTGGSGANFLVEWGATEAIPEPVIEAVMVGQAGTAGITFLSQGRVVKNVLQE